MDISPLKALINNISRFSNISCDNTYSEPFQKYYQTINEILELLRPTLDILVDSEIASREQLNKEFKDLDGFVDEARDLFESLHQMTSKVYFVLQTESLITKIQDSGLEVFSQLSSLHQYLSGNLSLASLEKLQCIAHENLSAIIEDSIREQMENSVPSFGSLVKFAGSVNLKSNQELLMEAVVLEIVKGQHEQAEKEGDVEYFDHVISLVALMHECLVKIKQSQDTNAVEIPADFCCPLSLELMTDPVILASGQTYERVFIRKWLDLGLMVCPKTRQTLAHTNLIPNFTVKALIVNWCESNHVNLPDPIKSLSLNQPSGLFEHVDPATIEALILPHSGHVPSRRHLSFKRDGASLVSSEDGSAEKEERDSVSGYKESMPSIKEFSELSGTHEQFQGHNQSTSVSSTDCNEATPEDVNEVSQASSNLIHTKETSAFTAPHREPEFPFQLAEARTRSHIIWRRPSERVKPRIASSSSEADLLGIETQVRNLVEDLKSTSDDVKRASTAKLRIIAKHSMDNRIIIANCGATTLLVNLLYSTDSETQENAVTALLNLSLNDNNKSAIANSNAIDPLIHVLQTGTPEAKENSAATLFSLSVIDENKVRIGRSGAIKPLVELLGNGMPRGKKDAVTALYNLSIFHENKAKIVEAGAVKYLVELMEPAVGLVDKAVAVLSILSTMQEGRVAIVHEGGIPLLVEVVELGSARGKENAAAALLQLCNSSNRFCNMVLQEGAVPPLVALSQSGTPRAKEKAQLLLGCLRSHRQGNAGRG